MNTLKSTCTKSWLHCLKRLKATIPLNLKKKRMVKELLGAKGILLGTLALIFTLNCTPDDLAKAPVLSYAEGDGWVVVDTLAVKGGVILKDEAGKILFEKRNTVTDTLIDNLQKLAADGTTGDGGAEYFWAWHTKSFGGSPTSSWKQVITTDHEGGGGTSDSLVMAGNYEADNGVVYDSVKQWRMGYASWFYSGSSSDTGYVSRYYARQFDTTVLESQGRIAAEWTLKATLGGSLNDTTAFNLIYGVQTGTCDKFDSLMLVYKISHDSNVLVCSKTRDYAHDTLTLKVTDTAWGAVDTIYRVKLIDEDGTWCSNAVVSIPIASGATPIVYYKLVFSETP